MDKKKLYALVLVFAIVPLVHADTLDLTPGHPERYVVRKGDTLWDISARFLKDPWRWPDIWEKNPQIKNPHLIYPGDVISVVYQDGKPVLRVTRGARPTIKLSPTVRSEPLDRAIPTIPIDAIAQFLTDSRVASEDELDAAPYVVSVGKEHLVAGSSTRVYVRGITPDQGRRFGVYRRGEAYRNQGAPKDEVLGYEALHVADAVLEAEGDPATVLLTRATREVLSGDRLLPLEEDRVREQFMPRAPDKPVSGAIVSVVDGVTQIGRNQIVVLNLGRNDGIEVGNVLAVYQTGATVQDRVPKPHKEQPLKAEPFPNSLDRDINILGKRIAGVFQSQSPETVTLPDERAGLVMVIRPFDRLSYALVMQSVRAMHVYDRVTTP